MSAASSVFAIEHAAKSEISPTEAVDPLFSTMNKLAKAVKRNTPITSVTNYCRQCGSASSVRVGEDQTVPTIPHFAVDVPVAPNLSPSDRAVQQRDLSQALSAMEAAEVELQRAKRALQEAKTAAEQLLTRAQEHNAAAWEAVCSQFHVGQIVSLTSGTIVRIENVHARSGRLTVSPARFFSDSDEAQRHFTQISVRAVSLAESAERQAAAAAYQRAEEEHTRLRSKPCPSPCAKCGHLPCYSYHYANRSDLSGWEIICCGEHCACFRCREVRDKYRRGREYVCCGCLPEYQVRDCECPRHSRY